MAVPRREVLLDALADHVLAVGLESTSYRSLAAAAGVRHNTLTHHFGSRSELLAAVFERIAQRLAAPAESPGSPRADRLRAVWAQMTSAPFASVWPTFFEVLGAAMRAPDQHGAFLRHVTEDWSTRLAGELEVDGASEREALAAATFLVASVRGLVMDLGSGGDRQRVNDAFELLVTFVEAHSPSPVSLPGGPARTRGHR